MLSKQNDIKSARLARAGCNDKLLGHFEEPEAMVIDVMDLKHLAMDENCVRFELTLCKTMTYCYAWRHSRKKELYRLTGFEGGLQKITDE